MSGPLKQTRHENFCLYLVAGDSQASAYLRAGFKTTAVAARAGAARLRKRPEVAARILELQAEFHAKVWDGTASAGGTAEGSEAEGTPCP